MSNEQKKPQLTIGMFSCPIAIPNFATDDEGNCEIAQAWLELANGIQEETYLKLHHLAEVLMAQVGGVVKECPQETIKNVMKGALEGAITRDNITNVHGILTPEGKVITDDDAIETWRKGNRIDN